MDRALIITSIRGHDNLVLRTYAENCKRLSQAFVVVGDVTSPSVFDLPGCTHLDIATQKKLPYRLVSHLQYESYARKNLGYLHAMQGGAKIIVETDDDNFPLQGFWGQANVEVNGLAVENNGWTNVYAHFSEMPVWPRGLPLRYASSQMPSLTEMTKRNCPIQQSLADENPDVDAVYRLTGELPVYFEKKQPVLLGSGSFCPINSQATTWFREAFPLLYLPTYATFRMTDIWRGFIAQRILWTCGWSVSFHSPTVKQHRNAHDLYQDFDLEIPGYVNNELIMDTLSHLKLEKGIENISKNLYLCYQAMVNGKFLDARELPMVEAWLDDLEKVQGQ